MEIKKSTLPESILVVIILFLSLALQAQYYPKAHNWERKSPELFGIDPDKIDQAVNYALGNEYSGSRDLRIAILESFNYEPYLDIVGPTKDRGGPAGLIIKNGYIIGEWGDIDRVDMVFSVTKSFLSTVVGLAFDNGLINSVNDPVHLYAWDGTFDGEHNMKINWEHLLNQSSDWSGTLFGMPDWADRPSKGNGLDDWKYRKLNEPGTYFKYNDVRVNLLAYSVLQVWRKPLPQILKKHIMDPIEASTTWRWFGYSSSWIDLDGSKVQSVSGGGHSGGGIFMNTTDMARFGLLYCRDGIWKGEKLISEEWIGMARKPSAANERYGYLWWLKPDDTENESVPESIFYAAGFGGNYIVIDQENDLVIVTRWLEPSRFKDFLNIAYEAFVKKSK